MFTAVSKLVMAVAVATLAVALSGAALARGGGASWRWPGGHGGGRSRWRPVAHGGGHVHFGGGHGGGHFAGGAPFRRRKVAPGMAAPELPSGESRRGQSRNVRSALNSLSHHGALRNARILGSPMARAQLVAGAAVVGWHGGAQGWWRHGNGGYGWVGPLFWPFAYYDIYDYTIWGDGAGFWGYGYLDIYAGLFGPYGYDGLSGYQGFARRDEGSAVPLHLRKCVPTTAARSRGFRSIRSRRRLSRPKRNARPLTISPAHRSRPRRPSGRPVRRRSPRPRRAGLPSCTSHRGDDLRGGTGAAAAGEALRPAG